MTPQSDQLHPHDFTPRDPRFNHAAEAGYLVLSRSLIDRRQRTVALTESGNQLLTAAHAWQDSVFAMLTSEWTEDERAAFEKAMSRLVAKSSEGS